MAVTGPCFTWPLVVAGGGGRLRVAIDTPLRSNTFKLEVVDPAGKVTSVANNNAFNYSFHVVHSHFHDDGILSMELMKVGDDASLKKVGVGTKSGFCPANQLFADWRSFDNEPADDVIGSGDVATGNCQSPTDGVLGLTPGWGDVCRWQRPEMYVEFNDQPDGLYVVRMTIDAGHEVLESRYDNNVAYALVKVSGDTVQSLERGPASTGPFDPHKQVFTGAGPASRD